MFEWLEYSILSVWVGESLWGYPIMLSFHVVGLAIVVGIFTILNFRLLGFFGTVEYSGFLDLYKIAWVGLLVNVSSGFALFSSQATFFITSIPFITKISAIVLGSIIAYFIQIELRSNANGWDHNEEQPARKHVYLASFSLLLWLTAIFGGRLIAYYS
tara:strand:- start:3671 stop:4144 length:474 start_codon:yes stop_codon:yes gene_type:complete